MAPLAFVVQGRLSDLTGRPLFNRRTIEGLCLRGRAVRVLETAADVSREIASLPVAISGAGLPDPNRGLHRLCEPAAG